MTQCDDLIEDTVPSGVGSYSSTPKSFLCKGWSKRVLQLYTINNWAAVIQEEHLICCLKGFYPKFEKPQLGCNVTMHVEMQTSTEGKDGSAAFQAAQHFKTSLDSLSDIFVVPYLGCGTPSGNPEELNCSGHPSLCLSLQMTAAERGAWQHIAQPQEKPALGTHIPFSGWDCIWTIGNYCPMSPGFICL